MTKQEVRNIAKKWNLPVHSKKDSTGICFIGKRNFSQFIAKYISSKRGSIVAIDGKNLGSHNGTCFYTIGQRKGLQLGGPGEPWFVAAKDHQKNHLIVVQGKYHPALYSDDLIAVDPTFVMGFPSFPLRCKAKIRYRQEEQECIIEAIDQHRLFVRFAIPQRAVTPGQSIVFYQDRYCIGGAKIQSRGPSYHEMNKKFAKNSLAEAAEQHDGSYQHPI
jgi:tRNA-specific 2-thiouridylase